MLDTESISFPNLGIILKDLPKSISVFGVEIAFYGIIICFGMILAMKLAFHDAKITGQNVEDYEDLALYGIIFAVVGARAYYVFFEWSYYKENLLEIFDLRKGGLAIYGGIIAGVIVCIVLSVKRKLSCFKMMDTGAIGLVTGQMIGRWGNFFNREAYGGDTDSLFAMRININDPNVNVTVQEGVTVIDNSYIQVHPTFLYESFWNLCLLIAIQIFKRKKAFDGEVFLWYISGYGLGRFFIEELRTDQLQIGKTGIAVSQLLSAVLFLTGITLVIVNRLRISKGLQTIVAGTLLKEWKGSDIDRMNVSVDIKNAMKFAKEAHKGQKWVLPDGSHISYYEGHLIGVYQILKDEGISDEEMLITAILHDTIEDCAVTYEDLKKEFGEKVADNVRWLTRKKGVQYNDYIDELLETASDIAVIIKLADRKLNTLNLFNQGSGKWHQKKINQALYMLEHFSERKLDEKYEGLKEKLLNDIELEINAVSGNIKNRKNT